MSSFVHRVRARVAGRAGRRSHKRALRAGLNISLSGALAVASLAGAAAVVGPAATMTAQAAPVGQGFNLSPADLQFILQQIKISEAHADTATAGNPCGTLMGDGANQIPDDPQGELLPWGLRTVDGTCNNLVPGQERFGSADNAFPRRVPASFRDAEPGDPDGPGPAPSGPTSYKQKSGTVIDSEPRVISNLIVDQTKSNDAAVAASGVDPSTVGPKDTLSIPNVAPDVGLSAPFNSVFTLFGQFFDHGLDLVSKSGGTVFMPLKPDDPLYDPNSNTNFMVLTRATNQPGPDGQLGTSDDIQEATNNTATFVDQSQTYTSNPSNQVFVREYASSPTGPLSTGKMLEGPAPAGGLATWAAVKEQAANLLGIQLTDQDALNIPVLKTDPYGEFERGPNGYPQFETASGLVEGDPTANGGAGVLVPANAERTGHAFLVDIAHHAVPVGDRNPADGPGPIVPLDPDTDQGTTDDGLRTTYDDEMLDAHFITGDGRANENIGLTAIHHVFHAEHNRLASDATEDGSIKDVLTTEASPELLAGYQLSPGVWDGERIFQAAKFVTEMEYQHLAFEEFARKVQPMVNVFPAGPGSYDSQVDPAIRAEFAHAVYRFGHSMLTETVARNAPGPGNQNIPLLDAFLNPPSYNDSGTIPAAEAAGSIFRGMSRQVGNEIDEFVTEALRNNLLGLPLDLPTINMARARDTGTPTLNEARRDFYAESNNSALKPYKSWTDLSFNLKHEESLVNFVAAYGTHPNIAGAATVADKRDNATAIVYGAEGPDGIPGTADDPTAPAPANREAFMNSTGTWANNANGVTQTGVDDIDLWVGGLAEKRVIFGGLLGSTFNYVFELQMEDLQFGDRFYYLSRTAGLNLLTQLEGNSFAELIQRNTDVSGLPADVFSRPDFVFNLENLGGDGPILDDATTEDVDESDTSSAPGADLRRISGSTEGSLRYTGPAHAVFNGTPGADRMWASEGDDTIRGGDGPDWMEGGDGIDNLIGGLGNDIMNDLFGDDTLKGGDGHDAMSSGQGFGGDLNQGGRGNDFIVGGNDITETLGGPGDDFIYAGDGEDAAVGDDGNDWIEGGAGPVNGLVGDNGNPFENDPNGGHDVMDGNGGTQDFHGEGGDDIGLAGPGIQLTEGMLGFDWFSHKGDPQAGNSDLNFNGFIPPSVDALRDRFLLLEGLSGWDKDDVLRGDDRLANAVVQPGDIPIREGHTLTPEGQARIPGLGGLVPGPAATTFDSGNIIIGGAGSDLIEGRGGDDLLDGDRWLDVRLEVPDLSTPGNLTDTKFVDTMSEIRDDVFAGRMNGSEISIDRRIFNAPNTSGVDTALFNDVRANYTCNPAGPTPAGPCPLTLDGSNSTVVVTHNAGTLADGTDTLRNFEELAFSDTVAPEQVVLDTATAGNGSATVTWTPAPGSVVTQFSVRVLDAEGIPLDGEPLQTAPGTATSLQVTGLTNGTTYRFDVRAENNNGNSTFSAPSVRVTPQPVAPDAPTIGTAEPRDSGARVTWTPPANDGGDPLTGYSIRVLDSAGAQVGALRTAGPAAVATVVTGLTNGQTYTFEVAAENSLGLSAYSAPSNAVKPGDPGAPIIGTASSGARGGATTATARWDPPTTDGGSPITGYRVRALLLNADNTVASTTTSPNRGPGARTYRMALPAGRYRFEVRALNALGNSAWSEQSNIVRSR